MELLKNSDGGNRKEREERKGKSSHACVAINTAKPNPDRIFHPVITNNFCYLT